MKDLDMMAWRCGRISLIQGKYAVEILKRFKMMECKAMTTPMASNLKLLSVTSDWVLDVPDKHETRYFLCCAHLEPVPDNSETCSLDSCKAYFEVPEGYN